MSTSPQLGTHVSVHLHRFATPRNLAGVGAPCEAPEGTISWRAFVNAKLGEDVTAERRGDTWVVVGLHTSAEAADATVGLGSLLPDAADVEECWHGSFDPFAHRGAVNWLDATAPGPIVSTSADDLEGPLAVLTTAGFDLVANFDMARAQDFARGVDAAVPFLRAATGNAYADAFSNAAPLSGVDGITFTIWGDAAAMRDAAYRPGTHKTEMDRYREFNTADRSSFTRLRPRVSSGTWQGVDPFAHGR